MRFGCIDVSCCGYFCSAQRWKTWLGMKMDSFLKHFCGTMQSKETGSPGLVVVYGKTARALLFLFNVSHT